jgi:hypothetical protein
VSTQMSLLAAPADQPIEVQVCWAVLHLGSNARADRGRGGPLFAHRHVPSPPPKLPDEAEWLAALDLAEEARRYNQAPRAVLDLSRRDGAGSNGPIGRGGPAGSSLMASSRGIEVDGRLASWPHLLAARCEQRDVEPEIARARDLAEAYHYLDYYGRVYADQPWRKDWTPVPLIRRLASEARELGGEPTLIEPRTDYMREGLGLDSPSPREAPPGDRDP